MHKHSILIYEHLMVLRYESETTKYNSLFQLFAKISVIDF